MKFFRLLLRLQIEVVRKINPLGKSQWAPISIFPRSGARGLERLPSLKYYNVLKWESRFTLGLNDAESAHYIKKCSNKNY